MQKSVKHIFQWAIPAVCISVASPLCLAQAQPDANPMAAMHTGMAKVGGSMHTVARKCGDYTVDELSEMKAQQKAGLTQSGMSAEQFERVFAEGEAQAKLHWGEMTDAEQSEACEQVKSASISGATAP